MGTKKSNIDIDSLIKLIGRREEVEKVSSILEQYSKATMKKPTDNLAGKRKLYYCFITGILELVIATILTFKFKGGVGKVITMPYVYLNMFILGVYPFSNAIAKFAAKKVKEKIGGYFNNKVEE